MACINETCRYLQTVIHDIGLKLKTNAVCNKIRRIRYGKFTLDHALVVDDWTVEEIAKNIKTCTAIAKTITPESASLMPMNEKTLQIKESHR